MVDNELLTAIENLLDKKIEPLEKRLDTLELQMKTSERTLKNEIKKSEFLILDEVERVHDILEKHTHDIERHLV